MFSSCFLFVYLCVFVFVCVCVRSCGRVVAWQERVAAAEDAVAASTTTLDAARTQYEEVSGRVVREFARFRRDKAADMKKIILDYVNVQVRERVGRCVGGVRVVVVVVVVVGVGVALGLALS